MVAHFSRIHWEIGQFFLFSGILCPMIIFINYLNLYKYIVKSGFGTDIANYFRIKRPSSD